MKGKPYTHRGGLRKKIYLIVFLMLAVGGAVVCAAVAAERSGMYWIGLGGEVPVASPEDNKGFFTVDVSDFLNTAGGGEPQEDSVSSLVPLAVGPLTSVPTLTDDELKLYNILSKNDGRISDEDKTELDRDIHWTEVVLEQGDTLKSISERFNISEEDLRQANGLKKGQKPNPSEVLYVPDSHDDVTATLLFVRGMEKEELALAKEGKPLEVSEYIVKEGDTLWGISGKFNLIIDTLIGSNQKALNGSINRLKPGMKLRVPNQNGVFVKVARNDTLGKLADKYGSSQDAVKIANAMKSDTLHLGEEIFLPGGKLIPETETRVASKGRGRIRGASAKISGASFRFRWPAMGRISSNFGWRKSPFGRRRVFHSGLDIAAPRGTPIKAASDGTVVHSGWMGGYGKAVVLSHSKGLTTLYGHCSKLIVRPGTRVSRGQTIALVGSTGRSTGNHVHFEVRVGGKLQNPLKYLR